MKRTGLGVHVVRFLYWHGFKMLLGVGVLVAAILLDESPGWGVFLGIKADPMRVWWFVNARLGAVATVLGLFLVWMSLWFHERAAAWLMGCGVSVLIALAVMTGLRSREILVSAPGYEAMTVALLGSAILVWMAWWGEKAVLRVAEVMECGGSQMGSGRWRGIFGVAAGVLAAFGLSEAILNVWQAGHGWHNVKSAPFAILVPAIDPMTVAMAVVTGGIWMGFAHGGVQRERIIRCTLSLGMGLLVAGLIARYPVAISSGGSERVPLGVAVALVLGGILYGSRHIGEWLMWASSNRDWIHMPPFWCQQVPFRAEFSRDLYHDICERRRRSRSDGKFLPQSEVQDGTGVARDEQAVRDKHMAGEHERRTEDTGISETPDSRRRAADTGLSHGGRGTPAEVASRAAEDGHEEANPDKGEGQEAEKPGDSTRSEDVRMGQTAATGRGNTASHPRVFTVVRPLGRGESAIGLITALNGIYGFHGIRKAVGCTKHTPGPEVMRTVEQAGGIVEDCHDENGGGAQPLKRMVRRQDAGRTPGVNRGDPLGKHVVGLGRILTRLFEAVLLHGHEISVAEQDQYEGLVLRPDKLLRFRSATLETDVFLEYETGAQQVGREIKEKLENYYRTEDRSGSVVLFVCEANWRQKIETLVKAMPRPRQLKILYAPASRIKGRDTLLAEVSKCDWLNGETSRYDLFEGPVRERETPKDKDSSADRQDRKDGSSPSGPDVTQDEWDEPVLKPCPPAYRPAHERGIRVGVLTGLL